VTSLHMLNTFDDLKSSQTFAKLRKFLFYVVHEWPSIIRQVCNGLPYKSTLSFSTRNSFNEFSKTMKYYVHIDSVATNTSVSSFISSAFISSERKLIVFQEGKSDGVWTVHLKPTKHNYDFLLEIVSLLELRRIKFRWNCFKCIVNILKFSLKGSETVFPLEIPAAHVYQCEESEHDVE